MVQSQRQVSPREVLGTGESAEEQFECSARQLSVRGTTPKSAGSAIGADVVAKVNHAFYIPMPGPRRGIDSRDTPLSQTGPETCRPGASSATDRQDISVRYRARSTRANLPLTSCTDCL